MSTWLDALATAPPPRPRIVCLGLCAFDVTWQVDELPVGSGKTRASNLREGGGGMAANAAVAAARLGGTRLIDNLEI